MCNATISCDERIHAIKETFLIYFRSVASWFDEEGTLLKDIMEKDVCELHNGIASEKKDK